MPKRKRTALLAVIHLIIAGLIIAAVLLLPKISTGCIFRKITGIPCPGCGMTRAAYALMRLDFVSAWYNNPGIFLLPVIIFLTVHLPLFRHRKRITILILLLLFAFIAIYVIRLSFFTIP